MSRPKHGNDIKWVEKTLTRDEVLSLTQKGTTEFIFEEIMNYILGSFMYSAGNIIGIYDNWKKQQFINAVNEIIKSSESVTVSLKYVAYRKGNAGLFWLPTDEYEII